MHIVRLKKLREKAGLTQAAFAAVFGFSNQRYNYYETGKREPDNETLIKFAEYFDVSIDYLLGNTDVSTPVNKQETSKEISDEDIMFALFDGDNVGEITDEMYAEVKDFANYVKQKYKDKLNEEK